MKSSISFALVLLISIACVGFASDKNSEAEAEIPTATISTWQYCYGCQQTNMIYANSVIELFDEVRKSGGKKREVSSDEALNLLCDRPQFDQYGQFVKYSCMKIVNEFGIEMAEQYSGQTSTAFLASKKEVYDLTKQVCVDVVKACPASAFIEVEPSKRRDKCAACHVVATDLDNVRKGMNVTRNDLLAYLEEDFCSTLGYRHQPYSWLESICDEMIEENVNGIIDLFAFQNHIAFTQQFVITNNLPDSMCEEFFKCKPQASSQHSSDEEL